MPRWGGRIAIALCVLSVAFWRAHRRIYRQRCVLCSLCRRWPRGGNSKPASRISACHTPGAPRCAQHVCSTHFSTRRDWCRRGAVAPQGHVVPGEGVEGACRGAGRASHDLPAACPLDRQREGLSCRGRGGCLQPGGLAHSLSSRNSFHRLHRQLPLGARTQSCYHRVGSGTLHITHNRLLSQSCLRTRHTIEPDRGTVTRSQGANAIKKRR